MKKVIIMTTRSPYQTYFINQLTALIQGKNNLALAGVFLSDKPGYLKKLTKTITRKGLVKGIGKALNNSVITRVIKKITYPEGDAYKKRIYDELFRNEWKKLTPDNIYHKKGYLFSDWYKTVQAIAPDIIIVHGGGIVPEKIIQQAKMYTLNLHWGISPVYRGSFCSSFCILNREIQNIGVTIHELSDKIDGGDIYASGRPDIRPDDTVFSIEMKLTELGTHLIQDILAKIDTGLPLERRKQDLSEGNMYYVKDYTIERAFRTTRLVRQGRIHDYCIENTKTD